MAFVRYIPIYTKRCAICRRLDIPEAERCLPTMWICPKCAKRIRQNMKEVEKREINSAAEDP